MTVPVILYGSSVLRKHSAEVTEKDLIGDISGSLFKTLEINGGIGLAAVQVNILKTIFVIDTSILNEDDSAEEIYRRVFVNPVITDSSDVYNIYKEGCLSIPGVFEDVERPESIMVRYYDKSLNQVEEELNGVRARIFQHEYDHLHGILFIDKIGALRRRMMGSRLRRIKEQCGLK